MMRNAMAWGLRAPFYFLVLLALGVFAAMAALNDWLDKENTP